MKEVVVKPDVSRCYNPTPPTVVPAEWNVRPFKHLARIRNGQDYKSVEDPLGPYPVFGSGGEFARATAYLFDGESVLLGRKGTIDKPLFVDGRFWTVDTMFYTEIVRGALPRFVYYLATTLPFDQLATRTALPSMTQEALSNVRVLVPPLAEQRSIAAFLDYETARIDELVREQERLQKVLEEKRQAVVSHAVTKGLNAGVLMKDSEVQWLGEIPAHWNVSQSRRLFAERKERARPRDIQLTVSQKYGLLPQAEFMEREGRRIVTVQRGHDILKRVHAGDFVISMRSFQGGLELSEHDGSVSSAYVPLMPIKLVRPRYFRWLFKSSAYVHALQSTSDLVRDGQAMRFENFAEVPLPLVPDHEQDSIARYLDEATLDIDGLLTQTEIANKLLLERRAALISAAVTGRINLRDLKPPKPVHVVEVA